MLSIVRRLFGLDPEKPRRWSKSMADRQKHAASPAACYCIGDVHGCLGLLRQIEGKIVADGAGIDGEKWIVLLGDLIDRGPSSAQVIDHLLRPPPVGFKRFSLAGNHEQGFLDFLDRPDRKSWWLEHGGRETLASYEVDVSGLMEGRLSATDRRYIIGSHVPEEHLVFLSGLPLMIETPDWILVHAGLEPGVPVERQSDDSLIWYRDDFSPRYDEWRKTVVHGHTPLDDVFISPHRIDVDTAASLTGRLSAVRLVPGEPPVVLTATGPAT